MSKSYLNVIVVKFGIIDLVNFIKKIYLIIRLIPSRLFSWNKTYQFSLKKLSISGRIELFDISKIIMIYLLEWATVCNASLILFTGLFLKSIKSITIISCIVYKKFAKFNMSIIGESLKYKC